MIQTNNIFVYKDHAVEIFHKIGPQCEQIEGELVKAGVPLPLPHRSAWARAQPESSIWYVGTRDAAGKSACAFTVDITQSRIIPHHLLLRVERFGPALTNEAREASLYALTQCARYHPRVLRVNLEVFSREAEIRRAIERIVMASGFRQRRNSRSYTDTVAIDLTPEKSEIFSCLHKTARRSIRAVEKKGFIVCPITDRAYAGRMKALVKETMKRTKGPDITADWASRIEFSTRHPMLSRLVGTFQREIEGPQSLVAFAWGCAHGDHVAYTAAASTREINTKVSLAYAPAWDLICWGKQNGASWFDFGGITPGHFGDRDPIGGISDFKRYFGNSVVTVGAEWILEPRPLKARLADVVSALGGWLPSATKGRKIRT